MSESLSRTDVRYWLGKVMKPSAGGGHLCKDYSVQIAHQGRRVRFALKTPNKDAAAKRAQKIYLTIVTNGWDATLEEFKAEKKAKTATVGELLAEVRSVCKAAPRTFTDYCKALRKIVADLEGIKAGSERFDYVNGGNLNWRERVDRVPLDRVTPAKVQKWMKDYVAAFEGDPVALKAKKNTANSFIRQAKALFSEKNVALISRKLPLPNPLPFEGVDFFRRSSSRYVSKINAHDLIEKAVRELGGKRREEESEAAWRFRIQEFKVFLLGICVGLRRKEIDTLQWSQVLPEQGIIRIEETAYFKPKSEESAGDVELDAELVSLLEALRGESIGEFVIESDRAPMVGMAYDRTRAHPVFQALYGWLRDQGVTDLKPLHTLRKEFGSMINLKYGIYAASRALRHADTAVTASHYLDKKERVSVGLGEALSGSGKD